MPNEIEAKLRFGLNNDHSHSCVSINGRFLVNMRIIFAVLNFNESNVPVCKWYICLIEPERFYENEHCEWCYEVCLLFVLSWKWENFVAFKTGILSKSKVNSALKHRNRWEKNRMQFVSNIFTANNVDDWFIQLW